jgi:hypothetical protein
VRYPVPGCGSVTFVVVAWVLCAVAPTAFGHVLRVEVTSREEVLGGSAFGTSGAYERILGRVIFTVPVANAHNRSIVDLRNAVNRKHGAVEFSADIVILRPKDTARAMGTLAPVRLRVETQLGYNSVKFLQRIVVKDEFDDLGKLRDLQNGWS